VSSAAPALAVLASGPDCAEADRARAVLLTLSGRTSVGIGEAFGVREDTAPLGASTSCAAGSKR
jgi:hypothetical protein